LQRRHLVLAASIDWPPGIEHQADGIGVVILCGFRYLATLLVGQVRNHIRATGQQLAKKVLITKLEGLREFHVFRAALHEELKDLLVSEVAGDLMRRAVTP